MKEIKQNGLSFHIELVMDESAGLPWLESDCHGIVSEWTNRSKKPSERILQKDRSSFRYYDVQASKAKALEQGWSIANAEGLSKNEVIAAAIEQDFAYLQGFCLGSWYYLGVVVTCLETGQSESLWRIESNSSNEYFLEVEQDLIQELIKNLPSYLQGELERLEKIQAKLMFHMEQTKK